MVVKIHSKVDYKMGFRIWVGNKTQICISYSHMCAQLFSHVRLFVTPWTVARQAPLSMRSSRQDNWSGLLLLSPGDLPNPEIEPTSLAPPALVGRFFVTSTTWEAPIQSYTATISKLYVGLWASWWPKRKGKAWVATGFSRKHSRQAKPVQIIIPKGHCPLWEAFTDLFFYSPKICKVVTSTVSSKLQPYLQTLPGKKWAGLRRLGWKGRGNLG